MVDVDSESVECRKTPMANSGYIYVLINPSMNGLVKVGRTTRDPNDRVQELSSSTGVPTPFILAFDAHFADCTSAEAFIHSLLEQQGYRVSPNREFFNAPLNEVIKIVVKAQSALSLPAKTQLPAHDLAEQAKPPESKQFNSKVDWEEVFSLAEDHYYGSGQTLQDDNEALKLFKQAMLLGATRAYWYLGRMHRYGKGCRANIDKALDYFKKGVNKGDDRCWAEMALLFSSDSNHENSQKCWKRYFESKGFHDDEPDDHSYNRMHYALTYICSLGQHGHVPSSICMQLSIIVDELHGEITKRRDEAFHTPGASSDYWRYKFATQQIEKVRSEQSA